MPEIRQYQLFDTIEASDAFVVDRQGVGTGYVEGLVVVTPQPTGVVPGNYTNTNLTVNEYGQLTAAADGLGSGGVSIIASADLTAGQIVTIWANSGVANAKPAAVADDTTTADGFVIASVSSGNAATVYLPGQVLTGLLGLSPGALYYLAANGAVTATTPVSGWLQIVGKAVSTTSLVFAPQTGTLL